MIKMYADHFGPGTVEVTETPEGFEESDGEAGPRQVL
jgi:hypothetical protein